MSASFAPIFYIKIGVQNKKVDASERPPCAPCSALPHCAATLSVRATFTFFTAVELIFAFSMCVCECVCFFLHRFCIIFQGRQSTAAGVAYISMLPTLQGARCVCAANSGVDTETATTTGVKVVATVLHSWHIKQMLCSLC